jgi:hypothetical protein
MLVLIQDNLSKVQNKFKFHNFHQIHGLFAYAKSQWCGIPIIKQTRLRQHYDPTFQIWNLVTHDLYPP